MKLLRCYRCGFPLLLDSQTGERLNARVNCAKCGNTDYVHAYVSGGSRQSDSRSALPLDSQFFNVINDLGQYSAGIDVDNVIRDLASRYRMSPLTIVAIANAFIGNNAAQTRFNPLRFVEIVPDNVSAAGLMTEIRESIVRLAHTPQPAKQSAAQPSAVGSSGWKELYDERNRELTELRQEYDSLLEQARNLAAEKRNLEDILNNR